MKGFLGASLFFLGFFSLFFRLLLIPGSDYPDIAVVSVDFLSRLGLASTGIADAIKGNPSCVSLAAPHSLILGSSYTCNNVYLSLGYVFYGFAVALFLLVPICFVMTTVPRNNYLSAHLKIVPHFIAFLPSTFYFLASPHSDTPFGLIGILSVYLLMSASSPGLIPRQPNSPNNTFALLTIILVGLYIAATISLRDSQAIILAAILIPLLILFRLKFKKPGFCFHFISLIEKQSKYVLQARPIAIKFLIPLFFGISILFLLLFVFNIFIMQLLSLLPGPLGLVGSHYSSIYSDILIKYPLPLRWLNLIQTAILRTPSYWGPSIISWLAVVMSFLFGSLRMLGRPQSCVPFSYKIAFLYSIVFLMGIVAIFPGYANYKYFIAFSPLLVFPFTFTPRASLISISLLYLDSFCRI